LGNGQKKPIDERLELFKIDAGSGIVTRGRYSAFKIAKESVSHRMQGFSTAWKALTPKHADTPGANPLDQLAGQSRLAGAGRALNEHPSCHPVGARAIEFR
jgi:hypothetical protein